MPPTTDTTIHLVETDPEKSLALKLKGADLEVQLYVEALKKDKLKLLKDIAKLQSKIDTLSSEITVLKEQAKIPQANISINL